MTISERCATSSATPTAAALTTDTRGKLRKLLAIDSSSAPAITIRTGSAPPQPESSSAACLVRGSARLPAGSTASESRSACTLRAARSALRRALRFIFTV